MDPIALAVMDVDVYNTLSMLDFDDQKIFEGVRICSGVGIYIQEGRIDASC